MSQELQ